MNSAELVILLFTLAFFAPLFFTYILHKYPSAFTKGQDAAGRGMAIGCLSILLMSVSALLALAAAITVGVQHKNMALAWRIVGLLPLAGSLTAALLIYTRIVMARTHREQRDYEHAMSIPAALIVDDDDARMSQLYEALRPSFPTLEISLRHPGALYWQQREWFPRLRVLYLSADAMLKTEGQPGELTQDLLADMSRATPSFPIVLHATSQTAADAISAKLSKAGWTIHPVIIDGEGWVKGQWRERAANLLSEELKKRPAPKESDS